jgi:hypothetical protein
VILPRVASRRLRWPSVTERYALFVKNNVKSMVACKHNYNMHQFLTHDWTKLEM